MTENTKKIEKFPTGVIQLPPSKSILHRAVICSALAGGAIGIPESASEDISATALCMTALMSAAPGDELLLDCGESGSTLRFLIPIAAALRERTRFTGRGRLLERPLGPYVDELGAHGASITKDGAVLTVSGLLGSGVYTIPGNISSQFVTGLLLALPLTPDGGEVRVTGNLESKAYVGLTLDTMSHYGVAAQNHEFARFTVSGGQTYSPRKFTVEADYSQAAFFLVAGALGYPAECLGLTADSKQGDRKIIEIIEESGGTVTKTAIGGITVMPYNIKPMTIDVSEIPDLVPPVAALLAFADGTSHIVNAARLRLKESDRLSAVAQELSAIGCDVQVCGDGLDIFGKKRIIGGHMSARGDHRIAMMGAVAAIRADGAVYIEGYDSVKKSYPQFWQDFEVTA